ncbi:hypothetical protein QBC46DRAFT_374470 [Diplogelasinospora grovesii]|uniref:Uncharacterized protein n=1 Tax=Diplogelasinospora grovesii TaxID=303347 RepID=A0AAN6NEV2_9PEZI|nr:hypothetical protein QBC46DRAFT_374470 [Diplogelasinospora grovesii]
MIERRGLGWFCDFFLKCAWKGPDVAGFVYSLDARRFATGYPDTSLMDRGRMVSVLLQYLESRLPRLRCILIDGYPSLDPNTMLRQRVPEQIPAWDSQGLLMLSMSHCGTELSRNFLEYRRLKSLVYLDISDMPGSLEPHLAFPLRSDSLSNLRILKVRGREINDYTALSLFEAFRKQLWSLDLSWNKLTDRSLRGLAVGCLPLRTSSTRGEARFEVEGSLFYKLDVWDTPPFVRESEWSATFSHPHRYLADAPVYTRDAPATPSNDTCLRSDGRAKIRDDSADSIKERLSGAVGSPIPLVEEVHGLDICQGHGGITHLYLNGNRISASGLMKMLWNIPGTLEHFECDSMSFQLSDGCLPDWLSKTAALSGMLGAAHLFRPVFSSNLQVLRIHHSVVTQLLTLEAENMLAMGNLWLAETFLLPRAELAYPQTFVPDMNPRLRSLTLTRIPRYSAGPLIAKLVDFLRLAAIQERAIQEARVASSYRGPSTLPGLRHIRLEFEEDPSKELSWVDEALDSQVDLTANDFSFFGESSWTTSSQSKPPPSKSGQTTQSEKSAGSETEPNSGEVDGSTGRLNHPPYTDADAVDTEYLQKHVTWKGVRFLISVWIGSGVLGANAAINNYMRLLREPSLNADPVPASPCHVAAGVPPNAYIYRAAWEAMLAPVDMRVPTREDLATGMRDVVAAIKEYRRQTKAAAKAAGEHFHWSGHLEVVMKGQK